MATDVAKRPAGYRQVVTVPGWRPWALTTLLSRVPDAMAPLALVLLGNQAGSFTLGGLASGAHAITEAAFAPWLGAVADRWRPHRYVRIALTARAVAYAVLAATATAWPPAAFVAMAGVAGGLGAGIPGQLRALLARMMEQRLLHPAMSLDTALLEMAWTVAPAAVAAVAAVADARAAVAVMAVLPAAAPLTALRLPAVASYHGREQPSGMALNRALWRAALPSLGLGLVGGLAGGVLDTAVPPTLNSIGSAASLAGVLFTGYSVASVLGGLVYGLRVWPGRIHRQAATLLVVLCAVLLPASLIPSLPVVALCVVTAGLFAAPQLTARSLALQHDLPRAAWSAGFSSLYAANGAGYGLAGFTVGALLPTGIRIAFAVPLLACIAAAGLAFLQPTAPPQDYMDASVDSDSHNAPDLPG